MEHMDGKLDRDGNRMESPVPGIPEPEPNYERLHQKSWFDYLYGNAPALYFLENGQPVPPEYWTEYERQALLGIGRERTRD